MFIKTYVTKTPFVSSFYFIEEKIILISTMGNFLSRNHACIQFLVQLIKHSFQHNLYIAVPHTFVHTCIYKKIHIHTYILTYLHAYVHTITAYVLSRGMS